MSEFETENYKFKVSDDDEVEIIYKPTNITCHLDLKYGNFKITDDDCTSRLYLEFEVNV